MKVRDYFSIKMSFKTQPFMIALLLALLKNLKGCEALQSLFYI